MAPNHCISAVNLAWLSLDLESNVKYQFRVMETKNHVLKSQWLGVPLAALVLVIATWVGAAQAGTTYNVTDEGVAIEGADPVAYFTDSKYVEGSREFALDWEGATWHFASEENRKAFAENPEKYAPNYGGWCAYAAARGALAGIDPEAWTVYEGKLYLNLNKRVQARWKKDIPGEIARADANWPKIMPMAMK